MKRTSLKRLMTGISTGILLSLMVSCSATWHVNRAVKKDSSILEKDTIVFTDSIHVITKEVTHDSTFIVSKDTVTIIKDNLTIRHFYHNDSVWIYGECASDTIVRWKTFEVPVERIVINNPWFPRWMWLLIGVLAVLAVLKKLKIL